MRLLLRYSLSYLLTREGRLHQRLYFFLVYHYDYECAHLFVPLHDFHGYVYPRCRVCDGALPCGRVFQDFHGYVYAKCHVCVNAHHFFHGYANDYAFFIRDSTNVLRLCDHDVHLKFLQNHYS